ACPYDALYIDPNTDTAAKCNFCAHRIDQGLNPSCVNICPEQAIRFGDLDDPSSIVSQMISRERATVRKPEKGTDPSLFYIDGDRVNLDPSATATSSTTMWSDQAIGVGHNEGVEFTQVDLLGILRKAQATGGHDGSEKAELTGLLRELETATGSEKVRRAYDQPDKGIQWGWEVAAYIWTKAISAGLVFVPAMMMILSQWFGWRYADSRAFQAWSAAGSLFFLAATGALLVKDLDQPKRFLYVLLRPSWSSWLVRGAYIITAFGAVTTLWLIAALAGGHKFIQFLAWPLAFLSLATAGYTALLFGQCKGRDFWQSPGLVVHMLVHAPLAGSALLAVFGNWNPFVQVVMGVSVALSLVVILAEIFGKHPSKDSHETAKSIRSGRAGKFFYGLVLGLGHLIPLALAFFAKEKGGWGVVAGIAILIGMAFTEYLWVYMPQRRSNV
ncbi:MAG: polysulfide reductase NrfD, partial [Planctomycetes bacterium]|nr:polysulfide reductase NrfD [Planctomycetota bacterium]